MIMFYPECIMESQKKKQTNTTQEEILKQNESNPGDPEGNNKIRALCNSMKAAAEQHIEPRKPIDRSYKRSEIVEEINDKTETSEKNIQQKTDGVDTSGDIG